MVSLSDGKGNLATAGSRVYQMLSFIRRGLHFRYSSHKPREVVPLFALL